MCRPDMATQHHSKREQSLASKKRGRSRLLSLFKWTILFLACIGITLLLSYWMAQSGLKVEQLQRKVSVLKIWGITIQASIVIAIGLFWRQLINWAHQHSLVMTHEYPYLLGLRNKAMAFLLAYLILIPIGPSTLLGWIFN